VSKTALISSKDTHSPKDLQDSLLPQWRERPACLMPVGLGNQPRDSCRNCRRSFPLHPEALKAATDHVCLVRRYIEASKKARVLAKEVRPFGKPRATRAWPGEVESIFVREALVQEAMDGKVRCKACERRCMLIPGGLGWCRTRQNRGSEAREGSTLSKSTRHRVVAS